MNYSSSRRSIGVVGIIFIAGIFIQSAYDVWLSYQQTINDTENSIDAQSRVIAEQTARAIQAIDVEVRNLVEHLEDGSLQDASDEQVYTYLNAHAKGLIQSDGLVVIHANGAVRAMSHQSPNAMSAINLADFEAFRNIISSPDDRLKIETSIRAPKSGEWVFPIGMKYKLPSGEVGGVVSAAGLVDYFEQFYKESYPDPSTRISLFHTSGVLLARHPHVEGALGKPVLGLQEMMPISSMASAKIQRMPSPVDGVDQFLALRIVPGYPLGIAISKKADVALQSWIRQAIATAIKTIVFASVVTWYLFIVSRQLRSLESARRSLLVSEERYSLAMTGSDEGHWLWEISRGEVYVSERLAELFGIPGGAQSMPDEDYFEQIPLHPDDKSRVVKNREDHVAGLTPRIDHEFRIIDRVSGKIKWIHTRAQCFRDENGIPMRLAGSTVDITEKKQAEAEREGLSKQLRQAQKLEAIGTLAGGIAHDFNNILSAILGYGELVQRESKEGTPLRRHIDAAMNAGHRAKSLVERILAFSRSGLGERVPVHVQSVLDEAIADVANGLPDTVELRRWVNTGNAGVIGDSTQLHQVVLNLATNALQAMKHEGCLEIGVEICEVAEPMAVTTCNLSPGSYIKIHVKDEGAGMSPDVLERVFDPFFTTKDVGVGTGLGLSLVHGIVGDLGGGIKVTSIQEEGTIFEVYLPVRCQVDAPAKPEQFVNLAIGSGECILVLDDEEALVRLSEEVLAELGYEPVGFSATLQALEAILNSPQRFDAIVTDESMPVMTGSELVERIRERGIEIPVVIMSGYVSASLLNKSRHLNIARVISKPINSHELALALRDALSNPQAETKSLYKEK